MNVIVGRGSFRNYTYSTTMNRFGVNEETNKYRGETGGKRCFSALVKQILKTEHLEKPSKCYVHNMSKRKTTKTKISKAS